MNEMNENLLLVIRAVIIARLNQCVHISPSQVPRA